MVCDVSAASLKWRLLLDTDITVDLRVKFLKMFEFVFKLTWNSGSLIQMNLDDKKVELQCSDSI